MAPRKPRRQVASSHQGQHLATTGHLNHNSEYESDTQAHEPPMNPPPPNRSNMEMNLAVLRRYHPAIQHIISQAANAVIYTFNQAQNAWEKAGIEGTLFVCAHQSSSSGLDEVSTNENYCLFVLNRRSLDNLILDLRETEDVEATEELLIMRLSVADEDQQKVMGIWIHDNKDDRSRNNATIQECWKRANASKPMAAAERYDSNNLAQNYTARVVGRKISLRDLFASQNTNT